VISRRWSGDWARPVDAHAPAPLVDVLITTRDRPAELAVTLSGLAAQDDPPFRVLVSDQSDDEGALAAPPVQAMVRVLEAQGRPVELHRHLPRRGIAEHRQFLLDTSSAGTVLFLDDDVWLEPGSMTRMLDALEVLGCGFVGLMPLGTSYLDDDRPHQREPFEPWNGPVEPERMRDDSPGIARWSLHTAANLAHVARDLEVPRDSWLAYKVAWSPTCVLYRRDALVDAGGFDFWDRLPDEHGGEDVAAQWRVMERSGGAGILPSGAVHLESPTTIPDRTTDASKVVFAAPRPA
jgi:GT2 family glycosyltransferase